MKQMTPDEMIAVITAVRDGKSIQRTELVHQKAYWFDIPNHEPLDFVNHIYRVKPDGVTAEYELRRDEPKPLECWVNVYHEFIVAYMTKEEAMAIGDKARLIRRVHMREVVE